MFGLGSWELLIVMFIALLIFGKRLPSIAKGLGQSVKGLKEGLREADVRDELRG